MVGALRRVASPLMYESFPSELVDRIALADLCSNVGVTGAEDLLRGFFREARERLAALRMLTPNRVAPIRFHLHTLHGAAGMFGLARFSALVRKLHAGSNSLSPDAYRLALDEIAGTLTASGQALVQLKSRCCSD